MPLLFAQLPSPSPSRRFLVSSRLVRLPQSQLSWFQFQLAALILQQLHLWATPPFLLQLELELDSQGLERLVQPYPLESVLSAQLFPLLELRQLVRARPIPVSLQQAQALAVPRPPLV